MTSELLLRRSAPESIWSTANVAEAMPGVMTPLSWSVFGPAVELGTRSAFRSVGVLTEAEAGLPHDESRWFLSVFFGRAAARVNFFCEMGDRLPGTSARSIAEQLLSTTPDDVPEAPTKRRYPHIALGFPRTFALAPRAMVRFRDTTAQQWLARIPLIGDLARDGAAAELARSVELFRIAMAHQCTVSLAVVQPVFEQLQKATGEALFPILGGQAGHEESALVADLWACSRGGIDEEAVIARHGYHGPMEGEISSRVWREERAPLRSLLEQYRERGDDADPARTRAALLSRRADALAEVLAGASRVERARVRAVVALADKYLPMRGVGKVAFLQALDLCRASARRLGDCLVRDGALDDPDDVIFLTVPELTGPLPAEARALIKDRRVAHERYLDLDLPAQWVGQPVPVERVARAAADRARLLTGTGVNAGVVTGRARVILDPSDADIDDGEILVARITDPGWAALLFLSAGLVVDIGGTLSHAAVVSRELGIPCVVDTRTGTANLRTGDLIRVDGAAGTVEVLEPAEPAEPTEPA